MEVGAGCNFFDCRILCHLSQGLGQRAQDSTIFSENPKKQYSILTSNQICSNMWSCWTREDHCNTGKMFLSETLEEPLNFGTILPSHRNMPGTGRSTCISLAVVGSSWIGLEVAACFVPKTPLECHSSVGLCWGSAQPRTWLRIRSVRVVSLKHTSGHGSESKKDSNWFTGKAIVALQWFF